MYIFQKIKIEISMYNIKFINIEVHEIKKPNKNSTFGKFHSRINFITCSVKNASTRLRIVLKKF